METGSKTPSFIISLVLHGLIVLAMLAMYWTSAPMSLVGPPGPRTSQVALLAEGSSSAGYKGDGGEPEPPPPTPEPASKAVKADPTMAPEPEPEPEPDNSPAMEVPKATPEPAAERTPPPPAEKVVEVPTEKKQPKKATPTPKPTPDLEKKREAEEKKKAEEKKVAEEKKAAEEKKKAEEKKVAEEKKAEERKAAEERAKREAAEKKEHAEKQAREMALARIAEQNAARAKAWGQPLKPGSILGKGGKTPATGMGEDRKGTAGKVGAGGTKPGGSALVGSRDGNATVGAASMHGAGLPDTYAQAALTLVGRYFRVPAEKQKSVTCTVSFKIQRDGTLTDMKVRAGTGDDAMDQLALDALKLAKKFPPIPDSVDRDTIETEIAFDYKE